MLPLEATYSLRSSSFFWSFYRFFGLESYKVTPKILLGSYKEPKTGPIRNPKQELEGRQCAASGWRPASILQHLRVWGLGFRVWGSGFRGLGCRVQGLEFRVSGLRFNVHNLRIRTWSPKGLEIRVPFEVPKILRHPYERDA